MSCSSPHGFARLDEGHMSVSCSSREIHTSPNALLASASSSSPKDISSLPFIAETTQLIQRQQDVTAVEPRAHLENPFAMASEAPSTGRKNLRRGSAKKARRGSGGGAAAQQETEARDVLESLRAACARRSRARISKAIQRVQNVFSEPWATYALHMEALQSYEEANTLLYTLSLEKGMQPHRA
jgi:hypothetical protein